MKITKERESKSIANECPEYRERVVKSQKPIMITPGCQCEAVSGIRKIVKKEAVGTYSQWSMPLVGSRPRTVEGDRLLVGTIEVLAENLGHRKHVDPVLLEDSAHGLVAANLPSIARVLQFVLVDICPDLLYRLGA